MTEAENAQQQIIPLIYDTPIKYPDRLITQFGVTPITSDLLARFEKVTKQPAHQWLRRGIFFGHRDLELILDDFENGKQIYLYSGRGPSSTSLHIGHMPSFMFMKWLQDIFNAIVIIQIADDEKVYFKNEPFEKIYQFGIENSKDIIACGFNRDRTFIFSNRDYSRVPCFQKVVCDIMKYTSINDVKAIFGIEPTMCLGAHMWPAYECAPCFSASFKNIFGDEQRRCLVVYGGDQDVFFRHSRNMAVKLSFHKPCSMIMDFLPALEGKSKMSSTVTSGLNTTIFMDDQPKDVYDKIKKYAHSGGKDTLKEHREKGANLEVDVSYKMLKFFELDDIKLKQIGDDYGSGKLLSSEIKKIVSDKIIQLIEIHKKNRAAIDEKELKHFYDLGKFTIKLSPE